jgi:predicted DNA-binding transcriptional regulator AlpA
VKKQRKAKLIIYTNFVEWLSSLNSNDLQDEDIFFKFYFQLRCEKFINKKRGKIMKKEIKQTEELLTEKEACTYLGKTRSYLAGRHKMKRSVPKSQAWKATRNAMRNYKKSDLDAWLAEHPEISRRGK